MTRKPMILSDAHQQVLLSIDSGMDRVQSNYLPAVELVSEGYCRWARGNPASWTLELTSLGIDAVCMLLNPDAVDRIVLDKVDERVCRILDGDTVIGTAIKYAEGVWKTFNTDSVPMACGPMSSPEAVLLMFRIEEARMAGECSQALDLGQLMVA